MICGIAGFSLSPNSRQNARELAHALLSQIETRGSHASGFAYVTREGKMGVYKQPKPGSQLSLAELPRNAKTVILHTRYATQGDPQDNRNNHPVVSTDNRIALVHNGVINNDQQLREPLGITDRHGKVDSLVIPSLISQHGVRAMSRLGGYAAVAWLDGRENGTLHIARLKNSPTAYTWLYDGSFVFASTQALLTRGLDNIAANYGGVFDIGDGRMFEVQDGYIMSHEASPTMQYSYQTYQRYSGATAGGHGTPAGSRSTYQQPTGTPANSQGQQQPAAPGGAPAEGKTGPVGSEVTSKVTTDAAKIEADADKREPHTGVNGYLADLDEWRKRRDAQDTQAALRALEQGPLAGIVNAGLTAGDDDEAWEAYIRSLSATQERIEQESNEAVLSCSTNACDPVDADADKEDSKGAQEGYYIVDTDGDISHYKSLWALEAHLSWLAKRTLHDGVIAPDVADDIKWCNFIMDIGHLDDDGELISWVDDMAEIDEQESEAGELQYVRDGISRVASAVKG